MLRLKLLVIGLGVLIVAATILVVIGIAGKLGGKGKETSLATAPAFAVTLPDAAGATIEQLVAVEGRLALLVRLPGGRQQVRIVDPVTGRELGRIDL